MQSHWISLDTPQKLAEAVLASNAGPVLIFKHSTRCHISAGAHRSLEELDTDKVAVYMLDVIEHRELSAQVAGRFGIRHESPQAILLRHGEAVWQASHGAVRAGKVTERTEASSL